MHRTVRVSLAAIVVALGANAFVATSSHAGSTSDKAAAGAAAAANTTVRVAKDTFNIARTAKGENDSYQAACGYANNPIKSTTDTIGFFQGKDNDCVEHLRDNPLHRRLLDNAIGMGAPAVLGLDTPDAVDVYDFATDIRDDPANADKKVAGLVPGTAGLVFDAAEAITDPGQMARNVDGEFVGTYEDLQTSKTYQAITDTRLGRAADGLMVEGYQGTKKLGRKFAKTKTGRALGKGVKWVTDRTFKKANKWVKGAREDAMPAIGKTTETTRKMLRSDAVAIGSAVKPAFQKAGRTLSAIKKDPRKIEGLTVAGIDRTTDAALDGLDLATNRERLADTTQRAAKGFAKTVSSSATTKTLSKTKLGKFTLGATKARVGFAKQAANIVAKTKVGGAAIKVNKKVASAAMDGANKLVKTATPGVKKTVNAIVELHRKPVRNAATATVKVTKKAVKVTKKAIALVQKTDRKITAAQNKVVAAATKKVKKTGTAVKKTTKKAKKTAKKIVKKLF